MNQPQGPALQPAPASDPQALRALLAAGQAHHGAGRLAEAEAAYRQVLAADPNQPDALHLLGVVALQVNRPDVAVNLIGQAVARNGGNPFYLSNLCSAFRRLGRLADAAEAGRRAVALDGNLADAHVNLCNVLADMQAHEEGIAALRRLLALRPDYIDQRLQLARALILTQRSAEAVTELNALLARAPDHGPAYVNLGVALRKLGRIDEAVAAYHKALEFMPGDAGALNNLGTALQEEDRIDEAMACFQGALAAKPDFPDAHLNSGLALRADNRIDEAIVAARNALRFSPDLAEAHTLVGYCQLLKGELAEGFAEYEWRTRMAEFPSPKRNFTTPVWDGRSFAGRTILIHDEQGVGDAIQFARYAQIVQARGAKVILECNSQLFRLFSSMPGVDQVISRYAPPPPHDAHVSLLSLPHLLGTVMADIPAEVPYLSAEPELAARWRQKLGPRRSLRVGLVWAGNPEFKDDRNRSPGLAAFLPLFDTPGVEIFALQKGAGRKDLDALAGRLPGNLIDLGAEIENFADTAAIMMSLDLVISSCTAPPHLAGALARPVWTVLPYNCDGRWLENGSTSPWYPTMRLFRQERRGDWAPVIERTRVALAEAAAARSPV